MANSLYGSGASAFVTGAINLMTDDIKVQLLNADYNVDLIAHDNLSIVTPSARVGSPVSLSGKNLIEGKFTSNDALFTAIGGGASPTSLVSYIMYKSTGLESTSTLIAYYDESPTFPVLTNGSDVTINIGLDGLIKLL